jgi:hypothetical protein
MLAPAARRPGRCFAVALLAFVALASRPLAPARALSFTALASPAGETMAPATVTPGAVVALRGTPHLWVADGQGVLHWAADTRALAGRDVDWVTRWEVGPKELRLYARGEPWLSASLLKLGDPIYLPSWETGSPFPTLLRVRSVDDLELFGVDGSNYGALVLDEAAWERRYGVAVESLTRGELPPAIPAAAGSGSDPRNRKYVVQTVDGVAYTYVPYWATQVRDPRLLVGLTLAATHNGAWREQIGDRLDDRETVIAFGSLPEDTGGAYSIATNSITINSALADDPGSLAAVLAHEVYHAVTPKDDSSAGCFLEEVAAFTWQSSTWSALPTPRRLSSVWGRFNDALVRAWRAGRVDDFVLTASAYREQCRGRVRPASRLHLGRGGAAAAMPSSSV